MLSRHSIQTRLMRVILITSGAVLLITFASFFVYEFFAYRDLTLQQFNTLARVVADNSSAALAFEDVEEAQKILNAFKTEQKVIEACLYRSNGEIFVRYPHGSSIALFPDSIGSGFQFSPGYLTGFEPVYQGDQQLGTLYIRASMGELSKRFAMYAAVSAVVMLFGFLLAYILSRQLQKNISIPIVSLALTSKLVSDRHDYSVRAKKMSDDEVGLLTDAFNQMLTEIERQNKEIVQGQESLREYTEQLEQKVSERSREYRDQRDFIETVLQASNEIIAVYDKEIRFLVVNRRFEERYNIRREDVLGKKLLDVFPDATYGYEQIQRAFLGEVVHNDIVRSDLIDHYYDLYVIPIKSEQEINAVLVTAHDITDTVKASENLKQAAEQLRIANEQLLRKNNELEQFAYVASHDLQEPLRKIQTFIELTKRIYHDETTARRYMDKIEMSAARMSSLIHDVLDYSRLGQPTVEFERIDLNNVIDNVRSDFELSISEKSAQIIADSLPVVKGNKLQLNQLFANLLSNALKFSTEKPVIEITNTFVEKSATPPADHLDPSVDYWKLVFKDNGIGFEQRFAEKVFTIFQRLNTREKYEGTGIGLALCKKIVENHYGHISVVSAPGKGTAFTIYLPATA